MIAFLSLLLVVMDVADGQAVAGSGRFQGTFSYPALLWRAVCVMTCSGMTPRRFRVR